jgi:hypothetical protein
MSDNKNDEGKGPAHTERSADHNPGPGPAAGGHAAPGEEDRTVFMPPPSSGPATDHPADGRDTVRGSPPPPPPPPPPPAAPADTQATMAPTNFGAPFQPRTDGQSIQIGDILNHIFEVKRFIARGGMGEVFEGVNVNTDERVAIKVMLPALAADANVIALFRKEARTLTRLQHEALVQYRVLAQEPQLGVLYIVTEYIDGVNLADVLGKIQPTPGELKQLLARLASGLRVAHALGAVHRDMSPDNVLLEGGQLGNAKIIDFGIAKDLDPSAKTIVGEGFAGKLNYVAPEQLGDFGREVGQWTDVYSLALVILAVAQGKNVQMGGSLVDAVDKRRAGPDLSGAPEELRPVLAKMLKANPKERLRSMDEVLAALGHVPGGSAAIGAAAAPAGGMSKGVLIGGGLAAAAAIGAIAYLALDLGGPSPEEQVQIATQTVNSVLPNVECSWLDANVQGGENLSVRMTGVAGSPANARTRISQALAGAGFSNASLNFDEVAIIQPQGCSALDAFGKIRKTGGRSLSVAQREFEMEPQPPGSERPLLSQAVVNFRPPQGQEFSLIGIEPLGLLSPLVGNRQELQSLADSNRELPPAERMVELIGPNEYRIKPVMWHRGWSGIVLLTGEAPFDPSVTQPAVGARGPDWQNRFIETASERDWKSEMIWFKSVDKQPN